MFGNLFEEDEEEGPSSSSSSSRLHRGPEEPPPPRSRTQLCGIKNQGGTCYLNSLLQTLLFTPEFREELFSLGPEELGHLQDKDKPGAKVRLIPLQLQRLFSRLLMLDHHSASTSELTDSFGWSNNEGTNQHDVQELNRILFSALENSLIGTRGSSFINRLYHGTIVNSIECRECGNVSQRQEDFLDLTVCVCGVSSLEEALWNMFVEEEMFEGNNLYRCAQCNQLVTAAKSAKLRKLPPFITMSLLRFSFDFSKCERFKETGRYSFPLRMDLRPFCEQSEADDSDFVYELFSVIIHKGGCYGGHYHAYIKDIDRLGQWEPPEEESKPKTKKKVSEVKSVDSRPQEDDPVSVLSAIISQESSQSVLVDQLGQKLMDRFGFSWNKKFKKQHGAIGKFLQSHTETFILVSNGSRVVLKTRPADTTVPAVPSGPAVPCVNEPGTLSGDFSKLSADCSKPSGDTEVNSPPEEAAQSQDRGDKMEAESQPSHWFDLNDSSVTSIRESDIEKQFQGKESAYMLFYRRATLQRPLQALNNPGYKIPPELIKMVQEENSKLQQIREEFEASNNCLELQLHLAPRYSLRNGALQPIRDEQEVMSLSFDRRRSVGELRLQIYQMQELWDGDMALTVAKNLPAGLHLYNTLTDDSVSLFSAGLTNNTALFVWNGSEVNGCSVMSGVDCEPVLLTVVRPVLDPDSLPDADAELTPAPALTKESRGFGGGATLGQVRAALGESEQDTLLCLEEKPGSLGGGGGSGWRLFNNQHLQQTLKELKLKDGDKLLVLEPHNSSVFSVNGDLVTVTTPSDCRWLQIEHQAQKGEEPKRVKVLATGNTLLSEVKLRAVQQMQEVDLQPVEGVEFCLRQLDCSGKLLPPVCEELSVREAGVRLMTSLTLCHGRAPTASQLFLNFSVGAAPSAGQEMELIVEKTCSVKQCLQLMVDTVGLPGCAFHLRRLDWCEEVGEALMDEEAVLSELNINSGDTLIICEGPLPPKGFLKLCVWCIVGEKGAESVNGLWAEPQCVCSSPELREMGSVELSEESTLEELKVQILSLPSLSDLSSSPLSLRVWTVSEGRRLGKILRGPQLTLRKLKLSSGTNICVQHLQSEEDLGPKELLLRVKLAVPGDMADFLWAELVWDASRDSSPRSLRLRLAQHYGLDAETLMIGVFQQEKHNWEEISPWNQKVSKKKKKKRAESLLAAPFHLKDGDVIAVKNLVLDGQSDFFVPEDSRCLQRRKEQTETKTGVQAEQKRKSLGKTRKPEVGLSISVGEFR